MKKNFVISNNNLNFEQLISPMEIGVFFDKYWEQHPLFISSRKYDYYSELFSIQELESYLFTAKLNIPELRLYSKSKEFAAQNQLDKNQPPSINEVYNAYRQGNTLIVNHLGKRYPSVANLCRNLEDFFTCSVGANLYLTPKEAQGFPQHFDAHDVFILQIEGSKHWRVYDAYCELPIDENFEEVPPGMFHEPLCEVYLQPGDLLYIPRGFVHEAMTSNTSSLHITIGVHVYRWSHVLATAITQLSKQDVRLRKSLPVGALNPGGVTLGLKEQFQEVLELFCKQAQLEEAVDKLTESLIENMVPLPDGHLHQLDGISEIGLDTLVGMRKGMRCRISSQADFIYIQFPGNTVKLPKRTEPALRFIAATKSFPVHAIPSNLSTQSKLVLVRRLIQEGLLTKIIRNS